VTHREVDAVLGGEALHDRRMNVLTAGCILGAGGEGHSGLRVGERDSCDPGAAITAIAVPVATV